MDEKEKSLIGRIIFKKYVLKRLLGKGCFSKVYLGQNIIDKKSYAIKTENIFSEKQYLRDEAFRLYNLKGLGIPELIGFGRSGNYRCLIQTLLGKTLNDYFYIEKKQKISNKDICIIAIQTLERIEFVHSKNYIHRDIKPSNFLFGNSDNSLIYIIDFGSARKYRNAKTGKHISQMKTQRIIGTTLFLSLNVLKGYEQSRRDDLESLGYMYIFLSKGYLPWMDLLSDNIEEILEYTKKIKNNILIEDLCKDLPKEFCYYMNYVKNLNFEEKPDYEYLKNLFKNILVNIDLSTWNNRKNILSNNIINKDNSLNNTKLKINRIKTINITNNDNLLNNSKIKINKVKINNNPLNNSKVKINKVKTNNNLLNNTKVRINRGKISNIKIHFNNNINNKILNNTALKEDKNDNNNRKFIFSKYNNREDSKEKRNLSKTNIDKIKIEGIKHKFNNNIYSSNTSNFIGNKKIKSYIDIIFESPNNNTSKSRNIRNLLLTDHFSNNIFNNNNSLNNYFFNINNRKNNTINCYNNKNIQRNTSYNNKTFKYNSNFDNNNNNKVLSNLKNLKKVYDYNENNNNIKLSRTNYNKNVKYLNNYLEKSDNNISMEDILNENLKRPLNYSGISPKPNLLSFQNSPKKTFNEKSN